ncbi:MAG TPA: pyridoxal-dependent decarboxylase [Burkholderiaceae bacterium]
MAESEPLSDTPSDGDTALAHAAQLARRFRRTVDSQAQCATLNYTEMLERFAGELPAHGRPAVEVIDTLVALAEPGLQKSAGSRFFGWVIGNSHEAGVAADWLCSAWGQNAGNPLASPAAAACEAVVVQWLLDLLGLPEQSGVGLVTGATMANFVAIAAARGALLARENWDVRAQGLAGSPPLRVLLGADAHATVDAALHYLGIGQTSVVRIATDTQGAILPDAFQEALHKQQGPTLAILQAGQINTGAFDPFAKLIPMAKAHNAWVHVDGAFGLWVRCSPKLAPLAAGIELADSWATDGHKWLQMPYDCGFAIVRDAKAQVDAMGLSASYLPQADGDRDPSQFVPELSRRARGFAAWALLSHWGRDGVARMVERHVSLAQMMARRLAQAPGVSVVNDVVLNQLIVRFGAGRSDEEADRLTLATIARIQARQACFAGGAKWRGRWVMRISVCSSATDEAAATASVDAMLAAWREVQTDT